MTQDVTSFPREIATGIYWLGTCVRFPFGDRILHGSSTPYLITGTEYSALVETGQAGETDVILEQLDNLLASGLPELRYLFSTHSELAHAAGVGQVLDRYPSVTVHGDVTDLHLVFPEFKERELTAEPNERFDLGGTEVIVVDAVFRDLASSRWFFDTARRVLFTGDGFAYAHYHDEESCGRFVEDAPLLDLDDQMQLFAAAAFHWTKFVDIAPYIRRLETLVFDELGAEIIAPAHGLPIRDPAATMPRVRLGYERMRSSDVRFFA